MIKFNIGKGKNPDLKKSKDEYIYNKSTIGGIDESKLEFKETMRPKVVIGRPGKGSWMVLFALVFLGAISGLGYYFYNVYGRDIHFSLPGRQQPSSTIEPTATPTPDEEMMGRLRSIILPDALTNDPYIISLSKEPNIEDLTQVRKIISVSEVEKITTELMSLQGLLPSETPIPSIENKPSTTPEPDSPSFEEGFQNEPSPTGDTSPTKEPL